MKTLLVGDHDNKTLREATAKALSCAVSLGGEADVLIAGRGCRAVAEQAAQLSGVARVLLADADVYEHTLAEPFAALMGVKLPKRLSENSAKVLRTRTSRRSW